MQTKDYDFNLAIVTSRFNEEITQPLYESAIQRLDELQFPRDRITAVWVPGAGEIPIATQRLARTDQFAAIICLGAVIRGDTSHFDYVCERVITGCQSVSLEYDIPVISYVLTTDNEEQAFARINKGREAVDCTFETISVLAQIG